MEKTTKEDIIINLSNNALFIELINLIKNNKNKILNNIINNKLDKIISIINKIDYDINNLNKLTNEDLETINDLIKDKTNVLTILIEIKKKRDEIYNYVNIISIIQKILTILIILIYIYLIYDLYFLNKKETNIAKYLFYLNILSNILLFTYIISLKNTLITIKKFIFTIKQFLIHNAEGIPIFIYIILIKMFLIFLLNKHNKIINLFDNGYILIIIIVILIVAILLYNMSKTLKKTYNPIADVELSLYIINNYGEDLNNYGEDLNNLLTKLNLKLQPQPQSQPQPTTNII